MKNKPLTKEVLQDLEKGEQVISAYPNRKERRKAEKINKKKNANINNSVE